MLNSVSIEGNVAKDPVMREVGNNGTPMLGFTLAHDNWVKGEKKTDWIKVVFFGKRAQSVAPYVKKGSRIGVSGSLTLEQWQDQQGQTRSVISVNATDVSLQSRPNQDQQGEYQEQTNGNAGYHQVPLQPSTHQQQPSPASAQVAQVFGGQVVQPQLTGGEMEFSSDIPF